MVDPIKSAANVESALFNGMVNPFTNMSIRAALWCKCSWPNHTAVVLLREFGLSRAYMYLSTVADQGEENADQACQANSSMWPATPAAHVQPVEYYSAAYAAMLRDWRHSKGVSFAAGTMQLPPSVKAWIDPAISNPLWAGRPVIREAQAVSLGHPAGNTTEDSGVAVTIDCGGASNWGDDHPPNKPEMSRRLALQLLHTAYGLDQAAGLPLWTGPCWRAQASGRGLCCSPSRRSRPKAASRFVMCARRPVSTMAAAGLLRPPTIAPSAATAVARPSK
eukprot:SAG22_NODE_869_length_6749_cov_3.048120_2_plen_278_part_00